MKTAKTIDIVYIHTGGCVDLINYFCVKNKIIKKELLLIIVLFCCIFY